MSLESIYKLSVIVNMIDNLSGPSAAINSSVNNTASRLDSLSQSFSGMFKTGATVATLGNEITQAALAPVAATFETRKALGELASLGTKDLEVLEKSARDFSDTWAGTTKSEFLSAAYSIKSGISSLTDEGVAEYTKISGLTAKATGASIDEMTSLFATGYGIYKDYYKDLSDMEFAEMFSAGIADSIRAFKTSGSGMAQSIQTLGAAATSANVPMEEQMSILGMLQATMSGSEAGTKYRAFLRSAAKGGEELGLKFTDANNQLLSMPEILILLKGKFGETIDAAEKMQLQKAFGTDEAVAMIDLLYNKTDDLQDNILMLYDSMGEGADVAGRMADLINKTEPEKFIGIKQQIHNIAEDIGNELLPTVNLLLDKGAGALEVVRDWIGANQGLVKGFAITAIVIGMVLMVVGGFIGVIGGIGLAFTKSIGGIRDFVGMVRGIPDMLDTVRIQAMYAGDAIRNGFGAVKGIASTAVSNIKSVTSSIVTMGKTAIVNGYNGLKRMVVGMASMAKQAIVTAVQAMPGLIASVWSFTTALLANPVTWVVVGIVALIAALILLWQNWDTVSSFISGVWNSVVDGVVNGFNWIKDNLMNLPIGFQFLIAAIMPFIGIPLLIMSNWGTIVGFFSSLWSGVRDTFSNGIQSAKNIITGSISWFRTSGAKIMTTFADGIRSAISKPAELVREGLAKVRQLLPFSDAKEGPLSTLTLSGRRVFETINTGMDQTKGLPAQTAMEAFSQMELTPVDEQEQFNVRTNEVKKINLREIIKEKKESINKETTKETGSGTVIQKLIIKLDISKLKDLPKLFKLLEDIEDYSNSNDIEIVTTEE